MHIHYNYIYNSYKQTDRQTDSAQIQIHINEKYKIKMNERVVWMENKRRRTYNSYIFLYTYNNSVIISFES